jgi:hypothetical protein
MGRRSFSAISTAAAWGAAAALAVLPAGGTASAADLPLVAKAPPKTADSGNPFWSRSWWKLSGRARRCSKS